MSRAEKILAENTEWLRERWEAAWDEKESGKLKTVSEWFFDDVTERQMDRIAREGLEIANGDPTKGQASDIIGLFEPAEEWDIEILKFFKIPTRGMNQTRASHAAALLFLDPENIDAWEDRPASSMQKEFYKYFDLKIPKNLKDKQASIFIGEYRDKLQREDKELLSDWDAYEDMYEEINDPYSREDYSIKKISLSIYRKAMNELKKEGMRPSEMQDNPDVVVNKVIQIKPEIQK